MENVLKYSKILLPRGETGCAREKSGDMLAGRVSDHIVVVLYKRVYLYYVDVNIVIAGASHVNSVCQKSICRLYALPNKFRL